MDVSQIQTSSWPFFLTAPVLFPSLSRPENYVHWTETPESHIYSADLPGVRKEEIRVEVEDSRYLIIRTERVVDLGTETPAKNFMRKFRLPERVDFNGISAGFENGVLTVTVPRALLRRSRLIDPANLPDSSEFLLARAA
ncbi:15.4 kDa class V heat shock protein [Aristolochia californica]|uniref:15.4 kDa class V heat shock protein n=1 Tax=Aristolochia californica TaxID=171875 RepID=UPI0035E16DB3